MQLIIGAIVLAGMVWIGRRLWPAMRSEPATWLGDGWNAKNKRSD